MARKNVKVVIPPNADELIELGEDIVAKHTADGAASALSGLDMTAFAARVASAKAKNALQKQLRRDAEMATEDRDTLLGRRKDQNVNTDGTVLNVVSRARDILLGTHKGNEQQLGQWGFEVNQSTTGGGSGSGGGGTPVQKGTVNGKVTNQVTLMPMPGVSVEVVGTTLTAVTDPNGDYVMIDVPAGNQTIRVRPTGMPSKDVLATVIANSTITVNIQVVPGP